MRTDLAAFFLCVASSAVFAAGNGAGAGGAGHQRAINSGLLAGEAGPAGAPNNPRRAPKPTVSSKEAPSAPSAPAR